MVENTEERRQWDRRDWYPDNRESERRRIEIDLWQTKRSGNDRRENERRKEEPRRDADQEK